MSDPNAQAEKVGADRMGMLERYNASLGIPKEASDEAPAAASASSDSASSSSDSATRPEGEKSVEVPEEPPVKDAKTVLSPQDKNVEKKDEEKLVSKKALDEEREKRKAKTLEARTAIAERDAERQSRVQLEARVKELEAKVSQPAKPAGAPAKEDEVAKQLAEENRRLKEENQKAAAKSQAEAEAKAAEGMQKLVSSTSRTLEDEGFPGFSRFTVEVAHALEAKVASGELDVNDITPELWAKTYKEEVYPSIKQIFAEKVAKDKLDAKNKAKKAASLVKNPGNAPSAAEDEDMDAPQTAQTYLKFRKTIK